MRNRSAASDTNRAFSPWHGLRSAKTMTGLGVLGFFVLLGVFGPLIWRTDPSALAKNSPPWCRLPNP